MSPLLQELMIEENAGDALCPQAWRQFVSDLGRQSPVQNGLVRDPDQMGPVLMSLADLGSRMHALLHKKEETLSHLQRCMPSLAAALRSTSMDVQPLHHLWPRLSPILLRLAKVFCGYREKLPQAERDGTDDVFECTFVDNDMHEWYPNAPVRRQVAMYDEKHTTKDKVCSKSALSSRFKMPGIFHFCCPHGICLGFSILHDHESPIHPFSTLFQRWRRTDAVRIVVMDNACNLHTYCLRREPWFFHNVWFLIDRLHYKNHVNCSSGYRIDNFPFLRHLSIVACEIFNSTLKAVARHAGFMGVERFFLFTKHYSRVVNDRRVEKVVAEVRRSGEKKEVWKSMNALIRKLQATFLDDNDVPCNCSRPCVFCLPQ
jgi:hypothetical protein